MFTIDSDMSIFVTRGDVAFFSVSAEENGRTYKFRKGDVIRMKVMEKKACENVMFQKDFLVEAETEKVGIFLSEEETKIGEVISKPVTYWYEIELNPYTDPQTIVGYDNDGAKAFVLYPEGRDLVDDVKEEDIPVVDSELSLTSGRPLQNRVIAKALSCLYAEIEKVKRESEYDNTVELKDIRTGFDGTAYESAGEAVRGQVAGLDVKIEAVTEAVEPLTGSRVTDAYCGTWTSGVINEESGELDAGYCQVSEYLVLPKDSVITVTELFESSMLKIYSYAATDNRKYKGLADTLYGAGQSYTALEDMVVRCMATADATVRMNLTIVTPGIAAEVRKNSEELEDIREQIVEDKKELVKNKKEIEETATRLEQVAKVANNAYDAVSTVESQNYVVYAPEWEDGKIDSSDGSLQESSEYEETTTFIDLMEGSTITASGTPVCVYSYETGTGNFIGKLLDMSDGDTYTAENPLRVRITAGQRATVVISVPSLKTRIQMLEDSVDVLSGKMNELEMYTALLMDSLYVFKMEDFSKQACTGYMGYVYPGHIDCETGAYVEYDSEMEGYVSEFMTIAAGTVIKAFYGKVFVYEYDESDNSFLSEVVTLDRNQSYVFKKDKYVRIDCGGDEVMVQIGTKQV